MTAPLRPVHPAMIDPAPVGGAQEKLVHVALGDRAYDIVIGRGVIASLGARAAALKPGAKAAIVTDDRVAPLHLGAAEASLAAAGIASSRVIVDAGEGAKSFAGFERVCEALIAARIERGDLVVALGGGVVGDLAGFVAATYMRGVPVVQMPTSLLAMVDAAIGGKTGVDTRAGKNLVGAFHHPALVIADPRALSTLPLPQLRNGLAEAIKHGVIASREEFEWIGANLGSILREGGPEAALAERLVRRHIEIKSAVVARDEREAGVRKTLNFGHTVAHAVESLSGYAMLHGECVAVGMVVEARIAARLGLADAALAAEIAQLLRAAGLPTALPETMAPAAVLAATRSDKKARAGAVAFALPARIGAMAGADRGFAFPAPDAVVLAALSESLTPL